MTTSADTPLEYSVFATQCPSRETLEVVTSRWGTLTLAALDASGTARFGELRRSIDGISDKMLSQTLKQLQTSGLVTRTEHPGSTQHVDYALTEPGHTVATSVIALVQSIYAVQPAIR